MADPKAGVTLGRDHDGSPLFSLACGMGVIDLADSGKGCVTLAAQQVPSCRAVVWLTPEEARELAAALLAMVNALESPDD